MKKSLYDKIGWVIAMLVITSIVYYFKSHETNLLGFLARSIGYNIPLIILASAYEYILSLRKQRKFSVEGVIAGWAVLWFVMILFEIYQLIK